MRHALLPLLLAAGCPAITLAPIPPPDEGRADNKLAVEGEFCTTDPDDLSFPVKILFLLDTSTSMEATDPGGTRAAAMVEVVQAQRAIEGVEVGLITFGQGAVIQTEACDDYATREGCRQGFRPADTFDDLALAQLGEAALQAAGTTDFVVALDSAISMLATDMSNGDPEELQNARYVVIFLSDGIPDADSRTGPERACDDAAEWATTGDAPDVDRVVPSIEDLLRQMGQLADRYEVRELVLHGVFAAAPETATEVKACGSTLMRAMSQERGGTFRDFSSGEPINFLFVDFTSYKRVFSLKSFTATNANSRPFSAALELDPFVAADDPTLDGAIVDSDADGLQDELEDRVGTSAASADTDDDGFSDKLEYDLRSSGFDPLDGTDADCLAELDKIDRDGDGLRDCEERFFGTNPLVYDSDNDGFGDGLEFLHGTNPSLDDLVMDVDFDGAQNAGEVRFHSRPDRADVAALSEHAYRYQVKEQGFDGSRLCYSFRVENVALTSTRGADAREGEAGDGLAGAGLAVGENRVLLEVTESPFDAPGERGVARLACARARFSAAERLKDPANGIVTLPRDAFVDAREFDPSVHCVDP